MLRDFAMRASAAAFSCSSRIDSVSAAVLRHTSRAAAQRAPLNLRFLSAAPLARFPVDKAASNQQTGHAAAVGPVKTYTYDPAAEAAGASAEIGEVDFDASLANSVRLIGVVANKRDLRVFERSKLLNFSLGFKPDRRKEETEWVNVDVWGPLAERAHTQLQKGDRVAVQGRLRVDRWEDRATGAQRSALKLVASSIARVRSMYNGTAQQMGMGDSAAAGTSGGWDAAPARGAASSAAAEPLLAPWDPQPAAGEAMSQQPSASMAAGSGWVEPSPALLQQTQEELWMDLFTNPHLWHDNRTSKRNPKAPDFKKKEGGMQAPALWIDSRGTPGWVRSELERLAQEPEPSG